MAEKQHALKSTGEKVGSYATVAEFVFSRTSNGAPYLGAGWCEPGDHDTASIAHRTAVRIPLRDKPGSLYVEIAVRPFVCRPFLRSQRLTVLINGTDYGTVAVGGACALGFYLRNDTLPRPKELLIEMELPDAARPVDFRLNEDNRLLGVSLREILVLATPSQPQYGEESIEIPPGSANQHLHEDDVIRGATGLQPHVLFDQFEYLGHARPFALAQRAVSPARETLLQSADIDALDLLRGLDFGFENIDDANTTRVFEPQSDTGLVYVRSSRYNILLTLSARPGWRVPSYVHFHDVDSIAQRVRTLQGQLSSTLQSGRKLFVFQSAHALNRSVPFSIAQAEPLLTMLRSWGPNALLWVVGDNTVPPGAVRVLGSDLFLGHVPTQAFSGFDPALKPWKLLCATAYRAWMERRNDL